MSKKQQPKDPSGFVFDARSGAVRAQGGASENMREKVQAVRAVVPNRSNTEIVLVLQHFDNAVDRAVQAFMEGNASEVLKEWTVTGKKKNKKKKPKPKSQPSPSPSAPGQEEKLEKLENWEKLEKLGISINGFHGNRSPSLESLPEPGAALGNGIPTFPAPTPTRNLRSSPGSPGGRKLGPSLERSLKDLQRCSVALARFRALLRDEVENSLRRVRGAFTEIQSCLMDREVALLAEMDKVKAEAMELLSLRQRRAEALRELTEAAPGMSEEQLQELRADIKHFVSERKFDEELGRAGRFGCDLEALRGSIGAFGQVSHPRPSYSSRSRCSSGPGSTTGSTMGSTTGFPTGSTAGSATGSTVGSTTGSTTGFPTGSATGSSPAFPTGSAPGSPPGSPEFPTGSTPGAPTEPPPTPQPPQRSRKPPGATGAPQRPPGTPRNPKNPERDPKNTKNPENPKNLQNAENPKPPKNPENSKSPENPKNPGDPKNPKSPKSPENPKSPKNPENSKCPENPKSPKSPENPKSPKNSKSPQNPKSPKNPENPENPKSPKNPENPKPGRGPRRSRPEGGKS